MGRIKRQSIFNTIIGYVGMVLGYVNTVLLLPKFFATEEVGLVAILINVAALFAQFAALGSHNVMLKYFPLFRNPDSQHSGFLMFNMLLSLAGFVLLSIVALVFKNNIYTFFAANSPLFLAYAWYILPLAFFTLYYNVLMSYLRSLHNTVVPSFIRDFLLKILVTGSISLFVFGLVDFRQFVFMYCAVNIAVTFVLAAYTWRIRELHLRLRLTIPQSLTIRAIMIYGLFAFLGNVGSFLAGKIDSVILADLMGLHEVGIYMTVFTIISAIEIPTRSMYKIAVPQVAELLSANDMERLGALYKRVSLINTVIGSILFIGIWVNVDNMFALIPDVYANGRWVVLLVGIGKLFDLVVGLNGVILLTSDRYKWDIGFNMLLVGLVIGTDYWLIPIYGINGAAIGTMGSLIVFNLSRLVFVRYFFGIHPFQWKVALVLVIAGIALAPGMLIPQMPVLIDVFVRSLAVSAVFFGLVYFLKVSADINRVGDQVLWRLGVG